VASRTINSIVLWDKLRKRHEWLQTSSDARTDTVHKIALRDRDFPTRL
jgi:hypothetical protein